MESHFSHFFHPIFLYLKIHPKAGELFTFIVAFCESLPIIGTLIPGTVTMTVVGILIGIGALPALATLLIASLAAFAGDMIGFVLGYHYNDRLRVMWPFKNHPKWLNMGEAFFKKHGGKSIVLGRFIGPARSTVPLVAGLLKLTWFRFVIAALPSAVLWATMYLLPGTLLGAVSHDIPQAETTRFFLYGVSFILIVSIVFWLIQHFFTQLARIINKSTDKLWGNLSRNETGQYFIRYITNQQNLSDHHQLTFLLTAFLSGVLYLILFFNVRHHAHWIAALNYPIFHVLQTIRTPEWNHFFAVITIMGMPKTIMMISILFTLGFLIKKQWRTAAHFFSAFFIAAGAVEVFKHLSHSLRPQGFILVSSSSSFPSGHTTLSFVMFSIIAFFSAQLVSKNYRWIGYTLSSILITIIAFSRLYLGAHWFIDIIGSILLGLSILLLCIIHYRRMPKSSSALQLSSSYAIGLFLIGLCIPWTINVALMLKPTLHNTTPVWPKQKISVTQWWNHPLTYAPTYRNNRFGKPVQPFNVQWYATPTEITSTLEHNGWELIKQKKHDQLKTTLERFASHQAQYHMPILPWLYHNKPPVLILIKHIPLHQRIIELHLWDSDIHLSSANKRLLLGAIDIRIPPKVLLSLKEHTIITLADKGGLDVLYKDTTSSFEHKIVHVTPPTQQKLIQKIQWNGNILLLK